MKFNIRMAQLSDIPYVYDICRKTGNNGQDATGLLSEWAMQKVLIFMTCSQLCNNQVIF